MSDEAAEMLEDALIAHTQAINELNKTLKELIKTNNVNINKEE